MRGHMIYSYDHGMSLEDWRDILFAKGGMVKRAIRLWRISSRRTDPKRKKKIADVAMREWWRNHSHSLPITTGSNNIAIGPNALLMITEGYNNYAFNGNTLRSGYDAGNSLRSGNENIMLGYHASEFLEGNGGTE